MSRVLGIAMLTGSRDIEKTSLVLNLTLSYT